MTAKDASEIGLMQEANDALGDSAELRRRLDEQGYIFLRQIMAKDKLLSLRQEMTEVLMEAGWLVAGTNPMDGIARLTRSVPKAIPNTPRSITECTAWRPSTKPDIGRKSYP